MPVITKWPEDFPDPSSRGFGGDGVDLDPEELCFTFVVAGVGMHGMFADRHVCAVGSCISIATARTRP